MKSEPFHLLETYGDGESKRFFRNALEFVRVHHPTVLAQIAPCPAVSPKDVTKKKFFSEYVWCVMASGFNAGVVYKKFPDIQKVLKGFEPDAVSCPHAVRSGMKLIANRAKWDAIASCIRLISRTPWDEFKAKYLSSVDALEQLPRIGPVVKYHLARNLGYDVVKPDLHLQRVAAHFKAGSPEGFCRSMQLTVEKAQVLSLGQIDYVLWCFLSHAGKVRPCCFQSDPETLSLR